MLALYILTLWCTDIASTAARLAPAPAPGDTLKQILVQAMLSGDKAPAAAAIARSSAKGAFLNPVRKIDASEDCAQQ